MARPTAHLTDEERARFGPGSAWSTTSNPGGQPSVSAHDPYSFPGGLDTELTTASSCPSQCHCPIGACSCSYISLQGLCGHLEQHLVGNADVAVPQNFLDRHQRWVCCGHLLPRTKPCKRCGTTGLQQKRSVPTAGATSPPTKARALDPDTTGSDAEPMSTEPQLSPSAQHFCPFPPCARAHQVGPRLVSSSST